MRRLVVAAALCLTATVPMDAWAKADCRAYPKTEWMSEADARARLAAQGFAISVFKVDGNCYEIYGKNKDGKKVEIYYDAKTLDVVKSEIEN